MSQAYDRATALLGMPGVRATRPTTVTEHNAILGHAGTHVVQTACSTEEDAENRKVYKLTIFLQVIDEGSVTQVVIPDKVCRAMLRQMIEQYWQHKTSGDVYAVRTDEAGNVQGVCGPLHHSEYDRPELLPEYDYLTDPDAISEFWEYEYNWRIRTPA